MASRTGRRPRRRTGAALLALVLAAPAPAAAPADGERVAALLAEAGPETPTDELAARLVALGPRELPALVAALVAASSAAHEPALLEACARAGRAALGPELEALADGGLRARLVALALLGRVGASADLALAARAATPVLSADAGAELAPELGAAARALLARDLPAPPALRSLLLAAEPHVRVELVRALGARDSVEALALLAALLGRDATLDAALIGELRRLARLRGPCGDELVAASLLPLLRAPDARVAADAAYALGHCADADSAPALIDLLEHQDGRLRAAAHAALAELGGVRLPARRSCWLAWYDEQRAWLARDADLALARLADPRPEVAARALGELVRHYAHRARLAPALERALLHPAPEIRRLACAALAQLATPGSAAALRARLDEEDGGVGQAAAAALGALARRYPRALARFGESAGG